MHRRANRRFWFYGADYSLSAQIEYLKRLKRITEDEMRRFVAGLELPEELAPTPRNEARVSRRDRSPTRREFRILEHVTVRRRAGRNYWARCPSCAQQNRDRTGDNLAILVADPRFYRCWAGCTSVQIRAALGCPIRPPKP